jgi:hypothetical protein
MKQYGIYEIMNDKLGHGMVDDYKRFLVKCELASDEDKEFYKKILDDINVEFMKRFNFNWAEDGC